MRLPVLLLVRLVLLERAVSLATPAVLRFQHRFLPSPDSTSVPEWQPLGSAAINTEMTSTRMDQTTGQEYQRSGGGETSDDGQGWYQVGVENEGDWVIASTRACLLSPSNPGLILRLVDSHLTSMSLQTTSSRCSNTTGSVSTVQLPSSNALWDVRIQRPVKILSPSTSSPAPPADPTTGLPIKPPPEKSFLAKWWMPLLGLALFAAGQLGSPDKTAAAAK